jgi:DNA-binding transcriptional MocR family regulator
VIGVPVDGEGMIMEQLEQICQTYHPRLLYTVPTYHNPTGTSLSPARRERLLQLAQIYDFKIAEDDVYGFLAYDETAPATLKSLDKIGHVLYMTGFSKILTPGLRLGALVADNAALSPLLEAKRAADLHSSPLLQLCLADYLRRRHFTNHLQHLQHFYKERRDIMLAAMARHLPGCSWTYPRGGMCVWVTLPEGVNERDFYLEAITRGVGITPGRAFFSQPQPQPYMRLCFGAQPPHRIEEGIAILGDLLSELLNRRYAISVRAARASVTLV